MTDATATPPRTTAHGDEPGLTCQVFRHGKAGERHEDLSQISEILKEEGSVVWLDAVDPREEDLTLLQAEFDLHPLAVEDALHAHQRPKIEEYGSYLFVVVQSITLESGSIQVHEIAIFAGRNFVVTVRHTPAYPLEEIEQRWRAHPEQLRRGGGFLLYTILDTIVDGYFPAVDRFRERVDEIEESLFANRPLHADLMPEIFLMKKDAQRFRRAAVPMRDVLTPIIRGDVKLFPDDVVIYFRDVYDHAIRVIDELDSLRDLVTSALEIHLSVVANRHNEVSKQLTVIATIFLPLSFIVGFFGQNFSFLVGHIIGTGAFWLLGIGIEALAVGLTLGYFKLRGWF